LVNEADFDALALAGVIVLSEPGALYKLLDGLTFLGVQRNAGVLRVVAAEVGRVDQDGQFHAASE
jgi:hypothetical protein